MFFAAFKTAMLAIEEQMNKIRKKLSSKQIQAKESSKRDKLERERNWFRQEALRLNKENKKYLKLI